LFLHRFSYGTAFHELCCSSIYCAGNALPSSWKSLLHQSFYFICRIYTNCFAALVLTSVHPSTDESRFTIVSDIMRSIALTPLLVVSAAAARPEIFISKRDRHTNGATSFFARSVSLEKRAGGTLTTNLYDVLSWSEGGAYYANGEAWEGFVPL
jgi:hypothetical protein